MSAMTDQQLLRSLRSIGFSCFVRDFESFSNAMNSHADVIETLMQTYGYDESGCKTRVSQARRIIGNNKSAGALRLIINAKKCSTEIRDMARQRLQNL